MQPGRELILTEQAVVTDNSTDVETSTDADASTDAHAWVQGFAEGWRGPAGADAFAAHFRPMLAPDVRLIQPRLPTAVGHRAFERESYLDPTPLVAAVATRPRAWPRYMGLQARQLVHRLRRRSSR
jgi:hypothetical protein